MRKLYVDIKNINERNAVIKGQDAKHLANVMRLSPGTELEICDGQGRDFKTEIKTISSSVVILDILEELPSLSESPAYIIFAQGMLKDKKMDMIIRHLTELGISQWIPFFAERSVPKLKTKRLKQRQERWMRIAREALNQCGRSVVPYIGCPVPFNELIKSYTNVSHKIIFWEKSSCPVDELRHKEYAVENRKLAVEDKKDEIDNKKLELKGEQKEPKDNIKNHTSMVQANHRLQTKIIILTGPEGGFTEDEINLARRNGFKTYSLGPRILRAETASIAACSIVQNIFGDFGRKSA